MVPTQEECMSHHLDSPIAREDVRLDITDLYAFRGETGTVLAINVCHSIAGDIPVPGYHHEGMYEFKIDLDGDAVEEITYRFVFGERGEDGAQTVDLRLLTGGGATDPHAVGETVLTGTTDQTLDGAGGERAWAGKAGDPFWIEPDVLHMVGHAFQDGTTVDLSDWDPTKAKNLFAGHSVYAIVLEIPAERLDGRADEDLIHVWALSSLQTDAGGWRPINRVGLPMIHPIFTQFNEDLGNALNLTKPSTDFETYGETIVSEVAGVVSAHGTAEDPGAYARTVAHRFLPNMLPYRVGTPASFGFAGWNGRTLTDNAPDVMFSLAANTPVTLGIGRESVTSKPRQAFPYVPPFGE
jgi:hypothetical protein